MLLALFVMVGLGVPAAAQSTRSRPAQETRDSVWQAKVAEDLRREEYAYRAVAGEAGVWSAPNRSQGLRSRVSRDGLEVFPRAASENGQGASWRLQLRTASFGRTDGALELSEPVLEVQAERAELDHGYLVEWFENLDEGIEQGWTIAARPAGAEPLWIGLEFAGDLALRIEEGARSGALMDACGELVLRYEGLMAFDATGRELVARLRSTPAGVGIEIDDAGALYPLTVDPVLSGPAWTAESNQAGALFGGSVSTAGDVNGDGYGDVIVGAFSFDDGQPGEGRAYVYPGSATGLATGPAWTAESNLSSASFGTSVAAAGDVNGDGYGDVIVGAPQFRNGQVEEGRAFVYLGSAAGLATSPAWTAESNQVSAHFGQSVSAAGDVNGDGYGDVLVGAPNFDNGQQDEGRAYVYLGSATGLATTPAWTAESDQGSAYFAYSVSTAGDVNGDGYDDVLIGAYALANGEPGEGRAYAYLGSATGLSASPAWTAESDQASALFGISVATAGDVDGDGYGDVIVGASYGESSKGGVHVYLGSPSGLQASPAWKAQGKQGQAAFGHSASTAGDVNGDGYGDVIVGAPRFHSGGLTDQGRTYLYLGSATGLSANAAWTAESNQASAYFGYSVSAAGDVNGDGYGDVIIGAHFFDDGQTNEGRAYTYLGSPSGLVQSPAWTAGSGQPFAQYGASVSTAGDVNGDGHPDVIVGAYSFDDGQANEGRAYVHLGSAAGLATSPAWTAESNQAGASFGFSVSTAGDVNGDGYADVIVGAPEFSGGQSREGRAFVYLGSASGLAPTSSWRAESDQVDALFGWSVSSAGDVNGDGYGDVIVGAFGFDNGQTDEGRTYLYLGSATGLSTVPAWTAESNQAGALFGGSVSTAGDVNGDGLGDVIVGAVGFDGGQADEGRAYLFLGSTSGLATSPGWTAESDQTGAQLGSSVSTAGDVNGDGYGDVIVGADLFDDGQPDEGRAYVYLGSASGLAASAAWMAESDQADAQFGSSVSAASDVNGDGYGDVIVGAPAFDQEQPDEGRVYVYRGSATGLLDNPLWTARSDQASASFGVSVSTADVNGDGYDDLIVGAPRFDGGQTDDGRAYVFMHHGGWLRAVQQRTRSDLAPLAPLGNTGPSGFFRIRGEFLRNVSGFSWASPATPLAWLEWEIETLGVPFDGAGIQRGVVDYPLEPAGGTATFDELAVAGPAPTKLRTAKATSYHWRARVSTNNPLFPHTAWFTRPDFRFRVPGHSP